MKHANFLLLSSTIFGFAVFTGLFFFAPSPFNFKLPLAQRAFLPIAGERVITSNEPKTVSLVFTGDIMLARAVERTTVERGTSWPFEELGELFAGADLTIGNLESTVRSQPRFEVVNEMSFDITPSSLEAVRNAGFTHVSLANNHTDDFGQATTDDTRRLVQEASLVPFGDPYASEDFIARETVNGLRVSLIGFHAFGDSLEAVAAAVADESKIGQFVIVFPHWGPEYQTQPGTAQIEAAQTLVKAGAGLIVGSHPHVIQTVDVIDGVPVIYSLGNFLFDQDFSDATMLGLTARVIVSAETIDIDLRPVRIVGRQTIPVSATETAAILTELGLPSDGLSVPRQ